MTWHLKHDCINRNGICRVKPWTICRTLALRQSSQRDRFFPCSKNQQMRAAFSIQNIVGWEWIMPTLILGHISKLYEIWRTIQNSTFKRVIFRQKTWTDRGQETHILSISHRAMQHVHAKPNLFYWTLVCHNIVLPLASTFSAHQAGPIKLIRLSDK